MSIIPLHLYVSISRAMLQNVANFRSTIDAAPCVKLMFVYRIINLSSARTCDVINFHSAGWHPLFSPMILFLCTN